MNIRLLRRLAVAMLAVLAFAQASLILAACTMDRGSMAQSMAMTNDAARPDMPCQCPTSDEVQPVTAGCVAHCTTDLQATGAPMAQVHSAHASPVLLVEKRTFQLAPFGVPPPPALPRRVLLHSYLI